MLDPALCDAPWLQVLQHSPGHDPEIPCQGESDGGGLLPCNVSQMALGITEEVLAGGVVVWHVTLPCIQSSCV